jgi:hypothetical protein
MQANSWAWSDTSPGKFKSPVISIARNIQSVLARYHNNPYNHQDLARYAQGKSRAAVERSHAASVFYATRSFNETRYKMNGSSSKAQINSKPKIIHSGIRNTNATAARSA